MFFGLFGGEKKRVAEMIAAARTGNTEKVKQLLSKGADINAPEPESGDTPLLAAIDKGQWETAEFLLKQGPDLGLEDKSGNSPLYLAVSRGDSGLAMVNLLLEAGVAVDLGPKKGDKAGATPLHIACATGANGCLETLLRHGASATKQIPSGSTPLHTAAIGGDQRTIDLLCKAGGSVTALNNDKRTPLHNCGITGNARAAAGLIQQGAAIDGLDAEGCSPLMRAVMKNHTEVAKVLLDHGADPDIVVRIDSATLYPLLVAAMNGYEDMVRVLLDNGANVTAKVEGAPSPVDAATHSAHATSAKLIAAAIRRKKAAERESLSAAKETAVVWSKVVVAITQRDNDGLRQLTDAKHFSSLPADSRLLVACVLGDIDLTRSILQAGADCNKSFADVLGGITPLVAAIGLSRSLGVAQLLLDAGADVNQAWSEGTTPIFEATSDQYLELAKLLVSKGADVNVQLISGLTPLIYATRNGAARCVDLFLDAGADINAVASEHGIGAFGWALNRLDLKLAEHLFERGAVPNFGAIETLPLAIAEHGSLAFVRALEDKGCKLVRDDQRGRMAFISARNPDPEVFDYFLNHGADPSEGNDFGYTPLILAALNNRSSLIRRYLERGDDASVRDIDGETALSLALEKRNNDAVAVLRKFHVEECDYSALTPDAAMLRAAKDGALGTILNLWDEGISINSADEEGNTPMLLSVKAGHLGVVRSLYHLGADINHHNLNGETALATAKASDSTDIVNSLQEFGALDAMDGEIGKLSGMFGGVAVFNAADTMFGRMSHPYKDNPPYDNSEADSETESEEDEELEESADHRSEEDVHSASVESKLDQIGQILDNEEVRAQLPEAVLDQLTQKLEHWRELVADSTFGDDELVDLNELVGMLGLGDEKPGEVARTPLFEAVNGQDLAAIKKLVKSGCDVNEVDGEGNPALLIAVLTHDPKLVDGLLKLGADPRKSRPDGKGPLFGAVRVGEDKICQLLLKAGAEVDATFSMDHNVTPVGDCTALYVAATLGQLSICKALLSNNAQVNATNDIGYTPLMAALDGSHEDVVDLLLKSGANVNPKVIDRINVKGLGGATPLYIATRKEDLASIRKLLKAGADVNRPSGNGWTPLKSAAQQGSLDIVKVLLDAGADPNIADDTNYTPLMNAVSGQHKEIVKLLLKFRADPNVQSGENPEDDDWEPGRTALMDAAVSGNVPIARELLKQGANPNLLNAKGRTALHSAAISANTDMVSLLLKSGADPDVYGNDEEKQSALDLALRRWASEDEDDREGGVSDVLEQMIKKAMPTDRGTLNEAALDLVTDGHLDIVERLRKHGVEVDPNYSRNGASQLFIIAAFGDENVEAAKLLLKIGADANYKSPGGLSVLSLAVRNGAVNLAQALLAEGADVMDRNSAEVLAYDLAAIYGHDELAKILITHMNRVVPDVDRQDSEGNTALMGAVKAADTKAITDLLARGADTTRRDLRGDSPLSHAMTRDLDEAVRLLRSAGAERLPGGTVGGSAPIVTASRQGALGTILDLLDSGVTIDATDDKGETALTVADVHPGVVKALAKRGADLSHRNHDGNTAYMIAAASNRTLVMRALEEVGSPVDEPANLDVLAQMQALLIAQRTNDSSVGSEDSDSKSDVVCELDGEKLLKASLMGDAVGVANQIAAGADINYQNDEGRTALARAISGLTQGNPSRLVERNFEQIVDSLLLAGADPAVGRFPCLVFAAMTKRLHLVNALVRAGADVNRTTEDGLTALFVSLFAPDAGQPPDDRCALALLKAGADPSLRHESGSMPIHLAAASNYLGALQELLELRPQDVNERTNVGITPLMRAAAEGHVDAVNLLLKFGADRTLKDDEGLTAKEFAMKNRNEFLVPLLS